jgi:hypothetical protein
MYKVSHYEVMNALGNAGAVSNGLLVQNGDAISDVNHQKLMNGAINQPSQTNFEQIPRDESRIIRNYSLSQKHMSMGETSTIMFLENGATGRAGADRSSYESKLERQLKQSYREAQEELVNGKFCIPYFTCAVDTENIKRVFKACSHILKKEHLEKSGLL